MGKLLICSPVWEATQQLKPRNIARSMVRSWSRPYSGGVGKGKENANVLVKQLKSRLGL